MPRRAGINVIYSTENLPKLESPILICGFPGSGYVGKMAVDHLIQELHAEHLARPLLYLLSTTSNDQERRNLRSHEKHHILY